MGQVLEEAKRTVSPVAALSKTNRPSLLNNAKAAPRRKKGRRAALTEEYAALRGSNRGARWLLLAKTVVIPKTISNARQLKCQLIS